MASTSLRRHRSHQRPVLGILAGLLIIVFVWRQYSLQEAVGSRYAQRTADELHNQFVRAAEKGHVHVGDVHVHHGGDDHTHDGESGNFWGKLLHFWRRTTTRSATAAESDEDDLPHAHSSQLPLLHAFHELTLESIVPRPRVVIDSGGLSTSDWILGPEATIVLDCPTSKYNSGVTFAARRLRSLLRQTYDVVVHVRDWELLKKRDPKDDDALRAALRREFSQPHMHTDDDRSRSSAVHPIRLYIFKNQNPSMIDKVMRAVEKLPSFTNSSLRDEYITALKDKEGYMLITNAYGAMIEAHHTTGLFYGCMTFFQLIYRPWMNELPGSTGPNRHLLHASPNKLEKRVPSSIKYHPQTHLTDLYAKTAAKTPFSLQNTEKSGKDRRDSGISNNQRVRREWSVRTRVVGDVLVIDRPHLRYRGFMLDTARAPFSLSSARRILRIASVYKLNRLLLREGDDELNAVRYEKYTNLGQENRWGWRMSDVISLREYARKIHVEIIPEIESLGHSNAKVFHYPELELGGDTFIYSSKRGEIRHDRKTVLNPFNDTSLSLLQSLYREWFDAYSQQEPPHSQPETQEPMQIHMGFDEVKAVNRTAMGWHLYRLLDVLEKDAKRFNITFQPIIWGDGPMAFHTSPRGDSEHSRQRFTHSHFRPVRMLWHYSDLREKFGPPSRRNRHLERQGVGETVGEIERGDEERIWIAGGSGSRHQPYSRDPYEESFRNLAEWMMFASGNPKFEGLIVVQWHGNMIQDWLPDFICGGDYAWNSPFERREGEREREREGEREREREEVPEFEVQYERVRSRLNLLTDAIAPEADEIDREAWCGIWLRDGEYDEDIVHTLRETWKSP